LVWPWLIAGQVEFMAGLGRGSNHVEVRGGARLPTAGASPRKARFPWVFVKDGLHFHG
jgi:hypothetical protein